MKKSIATLLFVSCLCLNVSAAVPAWTVEPSNFSNSMVMVGVLNIAGVESLDENDLVAAFAGSEARGVASLQYEAATDRYIAYLIVYSNTSGDELTFKLYDASADVEIAAQNTVDFVTNGATGNIGSPYVWSDVLLNEGTELTSFIFPESDGSTVYGAGTIEVPVGLSSDLTALTSSFVASPGSRVTVNNVTQISGTTVNDFSNPVTYHVESESGAQTADYVVFVVSTNHLPTDISLSASSLDENNAVNAVIGSLTAADDDLTHTFELVSGVGDTDNTDFAIVGDQLQASSVVDFETQNSYSIRIKATDAVNQVFEKALTINVMDVNETPTDVLMSSQVISENETVGTVLASLSATDQDNAETFTYVLTGGLADNSSFSVDGSNLITNEAFDFETKRSYAIQLTVTDAASNTYQELFTITVADQNDAPTALTMDNQAVFENLPFGTVIGTLSATDQDADDVQLYSLISGDGDADNSKVLISGSNVLVNSALDFETQTELSIRVEVKDAASAGYEEVFLISVLDANDSPTDLLLSNTLVMENEGPDFVIGAFSVVDTDPTTTTFSFVDGQNDNASFTIEGSEIKLVDDSDFESQDQYVIDVLATDIDLQTVANRFTIQIIDENEAPEVVNPIGQINKELETNIELTLAGVFEDVDSGDELTISASVAGAASLPVGVVFDASAKKLNLNSALTLTSFEVVLTATDFGGLLARDTIAVTAEIPVPLGLGEKQPSLSIFPNPVVEQLNLINSGNEKVILKQFNIRDLSGKIIQQHLSIVNNSIQVGNLVEGVYLLELKLNDEPIILRFIKAKK